MNVYTGDCVNYRQWKFSRRQIFDYILNRNKDRQRFYELAIMMFAVCEEKGLRLIVENPSSPIHYLNLNFPWKAKIVDKDRTRRGDYFKKPTQYWFVNCEPTYGESYQTPKQKLNVAKLSGHKGGICSEERSMISPDYARNFICDYILGKKQSIATQQTLF